MFAIRKLWEYIRFSVIVSYPEKDLRSWFTRKFLPRHFCLAGEIQSNIGPKNNYCIYFECVS